MNLILVCFGYEVELARKEESSLGFWLAFNYTFVHLLGLGMMMMIKFWDFWICKFWGFGDFNLRFFFCYINSNLELVF